MPISKQRIDCVVCRINYSTQAGTLFQGPLCVVARQLAVISVNLPSSTAIEPAILHLRIVGQADRNRALHGDMVTVELLAQPSVIMGLQVPRNLPFTLSEPPVYARVVHVRSVIYSSAQPFADSAMHPATPSPDKLTAVAAGVPVTRAPLISGHFDLRAAKAAGDHSVIDQPLIKFIPDRVEVRTAGSCVEFIVPGSECIYSHVYVAGSNCRSIPSSWYHEVTSRTLPCRRCSVRVPRLTARS